LECDTNAPYTPAENSIRGLYNHQARFRIDLLHVLPGDQLTRESPVWLATFSAGAEGSTRWITESYQTVASAFPLGGLRVPADDILSSGRNGNIHDIRAHPDDHYQLLLLFGKPIP